MSPEDPSLDFKSMTDRAANKVFFVELVKGDEQLSTENKFLNNSSMNVFFKNN